MLYRTEQPTREEVENMSGHVVLDFGTNWCGICQGARALIAEGLGQAVEHVKVEDGRGRPLGRSFGVKLWPTLIFLEDGVEVARIVRPTSAEQVAEARAKLG